VVGLSFAGTIFISSNKLQQGVGAATEQVSKFSQGITITLYSISFLMIPLASYQPAALALYWATSGCMGIIINLAILSPDLRRMVRIPKIPAEMDKPYTTLGNKLKDIRDKLMAGRK
jgi:membrane protein insertase Oxa1/YidC/SpoIIIJ